MARGSGGLRRIEFDDPVFEPLRILRVEVVRRAVDDLKHAPIAGDGVLVFAPLVMNVAEELPSVGDIRMALQDMAGGGLGLFQLAFLDEAKSRIDRLVEVPEISRGGEVGRDRVALLAQLQAPGFGARLAPGLLGGEPLALGRLVPRHLSDNGSAMTAAEISEGLARLGVLHHTTLPYSPYQNAKQEAFWGPVEGRLIAMLEHVPDLTLAFLNEAT